MKASRRLLGSPTAEQKSILTKCPRAPVDLLQEKKDMKLMSGMVSLDPINADVGVSQDSIFILSFFMENTPSIPNSQMIYLAQRREGNYLPRSRKMEIFKKIKIYPSLKSFILFIHFTLTLYWLQAVAKPQKKAICLDLHVTSFYWYLSLFFLFLFVFNNLDVCFCHLYYFLFQF